MLPKNTAKIEILDNSNIGSDYRYFEINYLIDDNSYRLSHGLISHCILVFPLSLFPHPMQLAVSAAASLSPRYALQTLNETGRIKMKT
jgi:hypothetical protein